MKKIPYEKVRGKRKRIGNFRSRNKKRAEKFDRLISKMIGDKSWKS